MLNFIFGSRLHLNLQASAAVALRRRAVDQQIQRSIEPSFDFLDEITRELLRQVRGFLPFPLAWDRATYLIASRLTTCSCRSHTQASASVRSTN